MLSFSEKFGLLPRTSASRYFWWLAFVDQPESIAGTIQAYHDAVFVGTGKKCDRKRNRTLVMNNIKKVKIERY